MASDSASSYGEIERLIGDALEQVKDLIPKSDHCDVAEYIEFGEYGVAYELLVAVLQDLEVARPDSLIAAGRLMGMNG